MKKRITVGADVPIKALCPNCGNLLISAFGISTDEAVIGTIWSAHDGEPIVPEAGNATVCAFCASIVEFTAEGRLIPLRPETRLEIKRNAPALWMLLNLMRDFSLLNPEKPGDGAGCA